MKKLILAVMMVGLLNVTQEANAVELSGTITYNDGALPMQASLRFYEDSFIPDNLRASADADVNGLYSVELDPGTYLMDIEHTADNPGWPTSHSIFVGPIIHSASGSYDVTFTDTQSISVTVIDEASNPMVSQQVQFLTSIVPAGMNENNIESAYFHTDTSDINGNITFPVPPLYANTSAGQQIEILQPDHWFVMLFPPVPYANASIASVTPVIDGGNYNFQAVVGEPVNFVFTTDDGTNLVDVNPSIGDYRLLWRYQPDGFFDWVGEWPEVITDDAPVLYLHPEGTYQVLVDMVVDPTSLFIDSLPQQIKKIMSRDLVVADLVSSTVEVSLPPTVRISGVARNDGAAVEIEEVGVEVADGVTGIYREGIADGYQGPPDNDGTYELVFFEDMRAKVTTRPREADLASAELRVDLPTADALKRVKGIPPDPPVFDLNVEIPEKMNRINVGSPSQIESGASGRLSVAVVSENFSAEPSSDTVSFTFDHDAVVSDFTYLGEDALNDGVIGQQYSLNVTVAGGASAGYIPLYVDVNGASITGYYILEVVVADGAKSLAKGIAKGTPTDVRTIKFGGLSAHFPASPLTIPEPVITANNEFLQGYRILEQGTVAVSGCTDTYYDTYQLTVHYLYAALQGSPKTDLVILHEGLDGTVTDVPIDPTELSGPPNVKNNVRIQTNRLGMFSLAVPDTSFILPIPSAVSHWELYK